MRPRADSLKEAVWFCALTLGLSFFVFWGPLALFQVTAISFVSGAKGPGWAIAMYMINAFMPSLIALALTWRREGKDGLKRFLKRVVQFKIGWRWYLVAVGLVAMGASCQILLLWLLGHSFDFNLFLVQLPSALPLILLGPLSEELGWRGYLQDRVQTRWNPVVAGIIVGIVWALWHLPLFLIPGTSQHELGIPFAGFFIGVVALSVLFAWLHNQTGGSIWTAVFFHWVYTYAMQVVATGATRSGTYNLLEYSPFILAAVVVAALWRGKVSTKPATSSLDS